mgnify:CR=1 FL=1
MKRQNHPVNNILYHAPHVEAADSTAAGRVLFITTGSYGVWDVFFKDSRGNKTKEVHKTKYIDEPYKQVNISLVQLNLIHTSPLPNRFWNGRFSVINSFDWLGREDLIEHPDSTLDLQPNAVLSKKTTDILVVRKLSRESRTDNKTLVRDRRSNTNISVGNILPR